MVGRTTLIATSVVVLVALAAAAYFILFPAAPQKFTLSLATGGTGGVYYPLGGAMASLWTKYIPGAEVTAEVTTASVDNMKFLRDGKVDLALTLPDTALDAYSGKGPFTEKIQVRALMVLYTNYYHIVTAEGKGINSVRDLVGKRVSVGAPGSGTEIIGLRILEAYGIDHTKDIVKERLGVAESAAALKDGKIQAFFWSGGLPTGAVLDYATTPGVKIRLLPHGDAVSRMVQKYGPIYFSATIPKGTYSGQDQDIEVVGATNLLVAHERMSKDLAYKIVKAFWERQQEIFGAHAVVKDIKLTFQQAVYSSVPFHEGAIQYYKERGVWSER